MKHIAFPFRAGNKPSIAFAVTLLLGSYGRRERTAASTRPKYGGTLRVQMSERVATIDPRQWPLDSAQAAAAERVDSLVFDRLVRLDDHGAPQPALAISWQHDAAVKALAISLAQRREIQ